MECISYIVVVGRHSPGKIWEPITVHTPHHSSSKNSIYWSPCLIPGAHSWYLPILHTAHILHPPLALFILQIVGEVLFCCQGGPREVNKGTVA
jgi:hypothetical protein